MEIALFLCPLRGAHCHAGACLCSDRKPDKQTNTQTNKRHFFCFQVLWHASESETLDAVCLGLDKAKLTSPFLADLAPLAVGLSMASTLIQVSWAGKFTPFSTLSIGRHWGLAL